MKKIFSLITVAFLAAASVFTSCDEDKEKNIDLNPSLPGTHSETPDPSEIGTTDELFHQLQAFNDSLVMEASIHSDFTRAGGWWRKMLRIVCADISGARDGAAVGALFGGEGAAIGGVVGAAIYSWNAGANEFGYQVASSQNDIGYISSNQLQVERAYAQTRSDAKYLDVVPTIQLNIPSKYGATATLVGKSHNAILDLCKGNQAETATIEEVTGMLSPSQITVIHSSKFITMVNKAVSTGDFTVDSSDATGNYIINLFMSVAESAASSQQDLHYIINRYVSIIEGNGSLSDEDKTQVYNALSVAAYSCGYWENYAQ